MVVKGRKMKPRSGSNKPWYARCSMLVNRNIRTRATRGKAARSTRRIQPIM
jgi:hypothetical protein